MIKKSILFVVSGPAGAGKGTICEEYMKRNPDTFLSISMTSRQPRKNDEDGKTYYFVSKEEFEDRIKRGLFLEYACYQGNYYGTPKDKVEEALNAGKDVILEIEVQGGAKIRDHFPEAVFVFVVPPGKDVLRKRLTDRGTETPEKIEGRLETAISELKQIPKYNYVIVNDDLEKAVQDLCAIRNSEYCRTSRMIDYINEVF